MLYRILLFPLIFCDIFGAGLKTDSIKSESPIVEIRNGKLLGKNFVTSDENEFPYIAFQSIPFAEPPIGPYRFMPPQPKKNWSDVLDATNEAPMCMQPITQNDTSKMSEDCLYLNVYTPKLDGNYPVMVWIYGGAFFAGSSGKSAFGPDYLIQENVVIVTVNYRVGIFGFLSTEDLVAPGNYALKDQIFGLKWVQENIRFFGGNPDRVTVFGESAGSASVSILLEAKPAKGLFHSAIMESGVSLSLFSRSRNPLTVTKNIAKMLNITETSSKEIVEKLRNVDAGELYKISVTGDVAMTLLTNPRDGLVFAPCIEPPHEGAVLTDLSYELLKKGNFNIVPVIVGFNSAEGNPFQSIAYEVPFLLMKYDLDHKLLVPIDMNVNNTTIKKEIGNKIKEYYFGKGTVLKNKLAASNFISDDQFVRPTNEFVRLVSKYTSVYYYEFSYIKKGDDVMRTLPGVGHGEDVAFFWNTQSQISKKDEPVRRKLVKLWTNFAKYRNPTPELDEDLDNVTWVPSNLEFQYLDINATLQMKNRPYTEAITFWTSLYDTYGNPPYDTY